MLPVCLVCPLLCHLSAAGGLRTAQALGIHRLWGRGAYCRRNHLPLGTRCAAASGTGPTQHCSGAFPAGCALLQRWLICGARERCLSGATIWCGGLGRHGPCPPFACLFMQQGCRGLHLTLEEVK